MPHYPRHRAPRNGNGNGLWKDVRGLLEPETGRGTAGLVGASLVPGVGGAIDVADFAAGLQDRDLARMGWATAGLLLPAVAGSTLRKIVQRGGGAADEVAEAAEFIGSTNKPLDNYVWMANTDAGQRLGNMQQVFKVDEAMYDKHIRQLTRGDIPFDEYVRRYGDSYASFVTRDDGVTRLMKAGGLEDVRPNPPDPSWVRRVDDLGSEDAIRHRQTSDTEGFVGGGGR